MASFRRYVAANVPEETRRAQVVVWNPRPAEAGEQAQIDYGQLGRWLDLLTGRLHGVGVRDGAGVLAAHDLHGWNVLRSPRPCLSLDTTAGPGS